MPTIPPGHFFLCVHLIRPRWWTNLYDSCRFPFAAFLQSHYLAFFQRGQFLNCTVMLHFCFLCLSFSLRSTSSGSYSWGLSVSPVTGMKVLRRLPMSIWASNKLTQSNKVFLNEKRALNGSSDISSISFRVLTDLSDWPLDYGYPGLDVTWSKHQSCENCLNCSEL